MVLNPRRYLSLNLEKFLLDVLLECSEILPPCGRQGFNRRVGPYLPPLSEKCRLRRAIESGRLIARYNSR